MPNIGGNGGFADREYHSIACAKGIVRLHLEPEVLYNGQHHVF